MNLLIVPLYRLKPMDLDLVEKNKVAELENIYYAVFFKDFIGIIFHIPDEDIYGCEMIYRGNTPMLITWGCYVQYLNLLGVALQKSYQEYLELNSDLKGMLKL